ncbi:MAG TPA: EF-hand domain-containing protein [Pirellulaceae bacterium]|nr:EF-hand domain-containing protein [Pirellulaceae bacterium]
MLKKICLVALAAALVLPVLGTAQEKKGKTPEEQFADLDKNGDKKLSKEEYVANREGEKKTKAEERFAAADKDKDGSLTLEEFKAIPGKKKAP